jgi:hypothetical protein
VTFIQGTSLNSNAYLTISSLTTDGNGNPTIGAAVENETMPTTVGAYQTKTLNTAVFSGYIARVNNDGTHLRAATYLSGSTNHTFVLGTTTDLGGDIVATGRTEATDFPTTLGAYQTSNRSANSGASGTAFVSKLSYDLSTLVMSTYLGGTTADIGYSVQTDNDEDVIVAGQTSSTDFPTTAGCYQSSTSAFHTAFVSTVSSDGKALIASSYLGGTGAETPYGLNLVNGNYLVVGLTSSTDFPTTAGVLMPTYPGQASGFVSVLSPSPALS